MENKTPKKHNTHRSSHSFYVVLSLCLIAVGVAAWSAVSAFSDFKKTENKPQETPKSEIIIDDTTEEPAQNELPKVEYEAPAESEPEPEPQIPTAEHFVMPVEGNILKVFDSVTLQYSATLGDMRLHEGVDIAAAAGSAVRAAGTGTVTEIYNDGAYGHTVVIDHGNGILAKYCGLTADITVKVGDVVNSGGELGVLDIVPIESADDSHLHLEMFKDGKAVSPLKIMGMEE